MEGEISINLRFRTPTSEAITMFVYAVFESSFTYSSDEGVLTNYVL
jgi:hypothetical protein